MPTKTALMNAPGRRTPPRPLALRPGVLPGHPDGLLPVVDNSAGSVVVDSSRPRRRYVEAERDARTLSYRVPFLMENLARCLVARTEGPRPGHTCTAWDGRWCDACAIEEGRHELATEVP